MDDDDEFGDLYTDVLLPFSTTHPSILSSSSTSTINNPSKPDLNLEINDQDTKVTDNHSTIPNLDVIPKLEIPQFELYHGDTSSGKENSGFGEVKKEKIDEEIKELEGVRVLGDCQNSELVNEVARVSGNLKVSEQIKDLGSDKDGIFIKEEIDIGMDDLGSEQNPNSNPVMIPGLSGATYIPGVSNGGDDDVKDTRGGIGVEDHGGDEWDSDSEDEFQIVLNDQTGHIGMDMNEGMGSDDEGEDLVIVADSNQVHQPNEEQEWDVANQAGDGERKDAGDAAKVNGVAMNAAGTRIGYGSHVYPSHHSQFKYVRPGVAVPGGPMVGPSGVPGQVRPLANMGPGIGRGRGEWRPMGIKTAPGMQKPFHSAFGAPWGNNPAGRGGAEFTLPSHKTVFDIDIDSLEDKLWRNPGIDLSDFFNFGMDEESWKDYCKQLEQLRLESTMQSRIRVYESGRSDQDYDPDLPPELAAAAGTSVGNANLAKPDGTLNDLSGQERGALNGRPPIPTTGRAIQVEAGCGERLPSIDTRPPRLRDSDAIIEIVLQGSADDDATSNDGGNHDQIDDLKEGDIEEDVGQTDYFDPAQPYNHRKREMGRGYGNNMHEGNGLLPFPPEESHQFNPGPRGRWPTRDRYPRQISERGNDVIPCEGVHKNTKSQDGEREKSGDSIKGKSKSPAVREASIDPKVDDLDNEVELEDNSSVGLEGDEASKDAVKIPSGKRQKLSSRVEQSKIHDVGGVDSSLRGSRPRSSDNSRARSGSSRDHQKPRDDGEEEVATKEEGRPRRVEDMKRRRVEDDYSYRRKDERVRHDVDRSRVFAKGREDSHISYPYRDWDVNNQAHLPRGKINERERDNSVGARQRRDERLKEEEMRKREQSLHRSNKVRESEKDEHSRKRVENGDWRGAPYEKDVAVVGSRQREKEEHILLRREHAEYRAREDPSRRKRPRDDGLDQRKRDEQVQPRVRDNRVVEDNSTDHSVRHREDSWRAREKDERRLKQPHEERNSGRSGRDIEDKTWAGNSRVKDESKRKLSEHNSKRSDRVEDEHRNQFVSDDRNPRHERSSTATHPSDRHRESGRSKESDALGSSKRKQEASSNKGGSEVSKKSPQRHSSSRKHKEDAPPPSDDEQQQISRKGRSKLERWTSNKDRDDNNVSKAKETDEQTRTVGSVEEQRHHLPIEDESNKDDTEKVGDEKHLDTVAKLKKRSERFKTPMPGDKEKDSTAATTNTNSSNTAYRKPENEATITTSTQTEMVSGDAEVKTDRPARKRRWISG
ncbi:hypothetical protein ACHQM5_029853 [Ranunculus cassubicifolius]